MLICPRQNSMAQKQFMLFLSLQCGLNIKTLIKEISGIFWYIHLMTYKYREI